MPTDDPIEPQTRSPSLPSADPYATISPAEGASAPLTSSGGMVGRYRIERVLGQGGFGVVYLAFDDQLQRSVAIKAPHRQLVSTPAEAAAYLAEARTVAGLDHPHIVPVYDVGSAADYPFFVVSKFIDGSDLHRRVRESRLSLRETAELVATVAEALHYAHKQGLVHRDVKPGNILLDRGGKPFVADFGLALREQDFGSGARYAGTPAYMSPEQARGEGHRVDGRSDIFSLGVVLYELLTGRRPFRAESHQELFEQITKHDVRPPRQLSDEIPKELERICLKALARRASERYSSARDLAEELRLFLTDLSSASALATPSKSSPLAAAVTPLVSPTAPITPPLSDAPALKIVPKGLRSFDAADADFFLDLLPGPRDREGLPESIRFWKTRIETDDPEQSFSVGLIYGPSGCGKSSQVKAGLLPRLKSEILPVYLEATAEETELRLLKGLRRQVAELPENLPLAEALAALRRGRHLAPGQKVLLVLDQFEQWLHAFRTEENTSLVQALRHCDGVRLQCLVLVRDDFWMAATRFLRELEVRLVEGQNSAAVDLFPLRHAQNVLAAYGRAFGELPATPTNDSKEQKQFIEQTVAGLAEDGKVISVRLALFAEMVKGKPWTPATLRAVGGTAGVGVAFLEETFAARTAPPAHRLHQKAAEAVLKSLLPEGGSEIKGHMRSRRELLTASGYAARPREFDELLGILDGGLRLITPTDPEGKRDLTESGSSLAAGEKYYQLTHDYLVPSLRDWLTRKQKETAKGRAELLLADRAAVWNARPENQQLPSLLEWGRILWLTDRKLWSASQTKMLRQARRYHLLRGAVAFLLLIAATVTGLLIRNQVMAREQANIAAALVGRVFDADTSQVLAVVNELKTYRAYADPLLKHERETSQNDPRKQLHASLALLPVEVVQADYLAQRLLTASSQELLVIREALLPRQERITGKFWDVLEDKQKEPGRRLRSACALAKFAPRDRRWKAVSGDVTSLLVTQQPFELAVWADALGGAANWLYPSLAEYLVDENRSIADRELIATIYGRWAADDPAAFERLEQQLAEPLVEGATSEEKDVWTKRRASLGVALAAMSRGDKIWPLLKNSPDPGVRSFLIDRFAAGGVDPEYLFTQLGKETDSTIQQALVLSLGEYGLDRLSLTERQKWVPALLGHCRDHPDAGVHTATEWLLLRWGAVDELRTADQELAAGKIEGNRRWYRNKEGQTFAILPPGEFWMGEGAERRRHKVELSFALSTQEVTVAQFLCFCKEHEYDRQYAPTSDCPVTEVSWFDAVAYCNWLSEQEGLPREQWCYMPNDKGEYAGGMTIPADFLQRNGYRLPTEVEWEFACRAGSETEFGHGDGAELLEKYAWFNGNSLSKSHPVGLLKPNPWCMADMHGNVWEWCQDAYTGGNSGVVDEGSNRVGRGGSWSSDAAYCQSALRNTFAPAYRTARHGFRLALSPSGVSSPAEQGQEAGAQQAGGGTEGAKADPRPKMP